MSVFVFRKVTKAVVNGQGDPHVVRIEEAFHHRDLVALYLRHAQPFQFFTVRHVVQTSFKDCTKHKTNITFLSLYITV